MNDNSTDLQLKPIQILQVLWNTDKCVKALAISIVLFIVTIVTKNPYVAFTCAVLLLSVIDSLGFFLTQDKDSDLSKNRIRYRLIYSVVQGLVAFVMVLACNYNWAVGIATLFAWWFCFYDRLFYYLREEPKQEVLSWLRWSLPVILTGKDLTWAQFNVWAVIGAISGYALCYFSGAINDFLLTIF